MLAALGASLDEILEWGECLPDCPHEPIEYACLNEPQFPDYATNSDIDDLLTNFTSSYIKGSDVVNRDVI